MDSYYSYQISKDNQTAFSNHKSKLLGVLDVEAVYTAVDSNLEQLGLNYNSLHHRWNDDYGH